MTRLAAIAAFACVGGCGRIGYHPSDAAMRDARSSETSVGAETSLDSGTTDAALDVSLVIDGAADGVDLRDGATTRVGPPSIFFTDLVSGPSTGGENDHGTILTIYGARFGAPGATTSVRVGGGAVARVIAWADDKVSVAIGSAARTGMIELVTPLGTATASVPFTVRSGTIRCVSTTGSNAASGLWGSCWQTLPYAIEQLFPGDIAYVLDGVTQSSMHMHNAALSVASTVNPRIATASAPFAVVAYPGARVVIDGRPHDRALRASGSPHWVFAGLGFLGGGLGYAVEADIDGLSVIGSDITCGLAGASETGCVFVVDSGAFQFLGNSLHDINTSVDSYLNAALYVRDVSIAHIGWNRFERIATQGMIARAVAREFAPITIEANRISGGRCGGILVANPRGNSNIIIQNNLVYRLNEDDDVLGHCASHAAFEFAPHTTGVALAMHNTVVAAGGRRGADGAVRTAGGPTAVEWSYNIVRGAGADAYAVGGNLMGRTNSWSGSSSTPPSSTTGNITTNPELDGEGRPSATSPVVGAAAGSFTATDIEGSSRVAGDARTSIGAYD